MNATAALASVLDDLAAVVDSLSDAQYADSGVPGVSGSVGGHVRHCLDHICALERALDIGVVNYDARDRDIRVEIESDLGVVAAPFRTSPGRAPSAVGARAASGGPDAAARGDGPSRGAVIARARSVLRHRAHDSPLRHDRGAGRCHAGAAPRTVRSCSEYPDGVGEGAMCTVSAAHSSDGKSMRLVINRDERRNRMSARPPAMFDCDGVPAAWPVDLQAGGTWAAITAHGLALCRAQYVVDLGGAGDTEQPESRVARSFPHLRLSQRRRRRACTDSRSARPTGRAVRSSWSSRR